VEVGRRDPAVKKQPKYIVDRGKYLEVLRDGDRCAALEGGERNGTAVAQFRCVIYDDRPKTCRDFTNGSSNCLIARRRVGMSQ
jgi:Fe-S-cluster containining protein